MATSIVRLLDHGINQHSKEGEWPVGSGRGRSSVARLAGFGGRARAPRIQANSAALPSVPGRGIVKWLMMKDDHPAIGALRAEVIALADENHCAKCGGAREKPFAPTQPINQPVCGAWLMALWRNVGLPVPDEDTTERPILRCRGPKRSNISRPLPSVAFHFRQ